MRFCVLFTSAAIALAVGAAHAATTWHVDAGAAGPGNGSPGYPFVSIQDGIDVSVDGDTVSVAPGTYPGSINFLAKGIHVLGAGQATTTIDAASTPGVSAVTLAGTPATATLEGFTVTGGTAVATQGAGIRCSIFSAGTIVDCTITGNAGIGGSAQGSGVVCLRGGSLTMTGCAITANGSTATGAGGVACVGAPGQPATMVLTDCDVIGNVALGAAGVYCGTHSTMTMTRCTVADNISGPGPIGGILLDEDSTLTMLECTVARNFSPTGPGAIECRRRSSLVMTRCTVTGNVGARGGGIAVLRDSTATLTNCTIADNVSTSPQPVSVFGTGLWMAEDNPPFTGSSATLNNCIVYGNEPAGTEIRLSSPGAVIAMTYSDLRDGATYAAELQGGWPGTGNIDADALFIDPAGGDFQLDCVSPCIDAGDPDPVFDDPDGTRNDMGAFFASCDSDGDGLSDADEIIFGTEVDIAEGSGCPDPLDPDSDGDGLSDGAEVDLGTDPCNVDTDDDGVPDDIDPFPLDPGGTAGFVESALRSLCDEIAVLDLSFFDAPNNNAARGRRNAMCNKVNAAANATAAGDYGGAIAKLESLRGKLDGEPRPKDWLFDSPERDSIRDQIDALIVLLEFLLL